MSKAYLKRLAKPFVERVTELLFKLKWIAVSIGTSLSIGNARDAIFVLSARDGRDLFRKYLPRYSCTPVAFLDGGFLAYSDSSGVRVLRIPE